MNQRLLTLVLAGMLIAGCAGEAPEPTAVPVAERRRPVAPNSLADYEVTDFLNIVRELPGGEFPGFEPAGVPSVVPEQEPEAAILAWRDAYRRSCDPANLAQSWRDDNDIFAVLSRRGYTTEQFAGLVRRISLAITADSLADRIDFAAAHQDVEQQLAEMTQAIHQLDVTPDPTLSAQERLHRREAMMLALQETTALSEFLRLLSEIPAEAREIADRRRSDLAAFLPNGGDALSQFERVFESNAHIVPAANWQPQ